MNGRRIQTLLLVALLLQGSGSAFAQEPFSIVVLPDTQAYTTPGLSGWPELFTMQTQWIVDNRDGLKIAFVLHEGDITNNNDDPGWANAQASLGLLDGVVPYILAVGNHDGLGSSTSDTARFNQAFPVSKFENEPTFGGVFEAGKMDNCYHFVQAGGVDWLIFALEFGPRDVVLDWANQVTADHPLHKVVVVTHTHVYYDDQHVQSGTGQSWVPTVDYGRENDGIDVWNDFLANHPNTAFVFNGHVLSDGQGRRVDAGIHGNNVYQMLCNFQMLADGGGAYLRVIRFYPSEDRLEAWTYSPYLDQYNTDSQNQFEYTSLGIFEDTTPPAIDFVEASGPTRVVVRFSEPVEEGSAEAPAHYAISDGIEVFSASLEADDRTVTLTTSDLLECFTYVLSAANVTDRASPPNPLVPGASATFVLEPVLLEDDFDDGDFNGWSVIDEGTISGPSDWHVTGGALEQTSNIYGPDVPAVENRQGSFLYWSDPGALSWRDYTLSVTLRTSDDDGMGVMFRYTDPGNYYKVDLDRQRNFHKLFRMADGVESTLAAVAGSYPQNIDILLQVEVSGNAFTVWMDGVDVFSGPVVDAQGGLESGSVALYVWGNVGAVFDDVRVRALNTCTCQDSDGDGHPAAVCGGDDCDDFEGGVHPGAEEVCGDGIDNDCDGQTDDPSNCAEDGEPDAGDAGGDEGLDAGDSSGDAAGADLLADAGGDEPAGTDPGTEQTDAGDAGDLVDGGCGCGHPAPPGCPLVMLLVVWAFRYFRSSREPGSGSVQGRPATRVPQPGTAGSWQPPGPGCPVRSPLDNPGG